MVTVLQLTSRRSQALSRPELLPSTRLGPASDGEPAFVPEGADDPDRAPSADAPEPLVTLEIKQPQQFELPLHERGRVPYR